MTTQLFQVCKSVGSRRHRFNSIATDYGGSRIGPVRRVWYQHLLAWIATLGQRCANHHQAGHLTLRAGRRLRSHSGEASYSGKTLLDSKDYLERTLRKMGGGERMKTGEAFDASDLLVDTRVVFHRARAQRIKPVIDAIVPGRKSSEVPNHIDLGKLGHSFQLIIAKQTAVDQLIVALLGHVEP